MTEDQEGAKTSHRYLCAWLGVAGGAAVMQFLVGKVHEDDQAAIYSLKPCIPVLEPFIIQRTAGIDPQTRQMTYTPLGVVDVFFPVARGIIQNVNLGQFHSWRILGDSSYDRAISEIYENTFAETLAKQAGLHIPKPTLAQHPGVQ